MIDRITGKSRVFCVLGHPIGHSLSPAMQNAALREMDLDAVYVAFDVPPAGLGEAVRGLRALGVAGVNCTIPHKEALLEVVDRLSPDAERIGAVNTLRFTEEGIEGHNTDAPGFLAALRAEGVEPAAKRAVVLGAGGSARAVAVALAGAGARLVISNRNEARAKDLCADMQHLMGAQAEPLPLEAEPLERAVREADLLINTTSVGMTPRTEESPPVPLEAFHRKLFVYDLIYNPFETRLLQSAREQGARTANGVGMLAHQGALALELWTGRQAPVALMQAVVLQELTKRSSPS